jgi:hypothetical protein
MYKKILNNERIIHNDTRILTNETRVLANETNLLTRDTKLLTRETKILAGILVVLFVLTIAAFIIAIIAEVNSVNSASKLKQTPTKVEKANGFGGSISNNSLEITNTTTGILKGSPPSIIQATNQDITSSLLTNFKLLQGPITELDTLLTAIGKLYGNTPPVITISVVDQNGFGAATGPALILSISSSVPNGVLSNSGGMMVAATNQDITSKLLTGFVSGAGTVGPTDSLLQAVQKLNGNASLTTANVEAGNGFGFAPGPSITLTVILSGLLKSDGTSLQVAVATDITSQLLTNFNVMTGVIDDTDSILTALGTLYGNSIRDALAGTSHRIIITGDTPQMIDIASDYVGQTSLTTLGTVSTGVWNGTLIDLAHGGTNANLTASNGGIFYSTASAAAILAATVTARQILLSGASGAPSWSTATYPATTIINQLLYSSATSIVGGLATTSNGVLITSSGGVPSWLALVDNGVLISSSTGVPSWLPAGTTGQVLTATTGSPPTWGSGFTAYTGTLDRITVTSFVIDIASTYVGQTSLTTLGTVSTGVWNGTLIDLAHGGTNANLTASNGGIFYSTASAAAILAATATARQILLSGASGAPSWSTATYPATTIINQLLYSSAASVIQGLATTNNGVLITSSGGVPSWLTLVDNGVLISSATGVPSWLPDGTTGQVLTATTGSPPTWTTLSGSSITGAALTKTDDTNVTLTLAGTPTSALLQATSLTLGWTGQLSLSRGGTNANLAASVSNGGIVYSTASAFAILAGTATASQILMSGSTAAPSWSTATYPSSTTINQLLYSSAANTLAGLATVTSGVLTTSAAGIPFWVASSNNGVFISSAGGTPSWLAAGTTGQVLTATTGSPATWGSLPGGPFLPLAGGTMNGNIDMGSHTITNITFLGVNDGNSNVVIGNNSGATASTFGVIIGVAATVSGAFSFRCVVVGEGAAAAAADCTSLGTSASVTGQFGMAIGSSAVAVTNATAVGTGANANGNGSISFGALAFATTSGSIQIGANTTNATANSCQIGNGSIVNIRASNTACDLGTVSVPFQTVYLSGSVSGASFTRTADSIVSNAGTSTTSNIASFSDGNGKTITDSGVSATLGALTAASLTWDTQSAANTSAWSSICWDPIALVYVAVAKTASTSAAQRSVDGITWTAGTSINIAGGWSSVAFGSTGYDVAVSPNTTGTLASYSTDGGSTWSQTSLTTPASGTTNTINSVCYAPEIDTWLAVSSAGTSRAMYAIGTPNIAWTAASISSDTWSSVCWSPLLSLFVAVSSTASTTAASSSPNGITWTVRTTPNTGTPTWASICWSPLLRMFVAVSSTAATTAAMYSYDGINWVQATTPNGGTQTWSSVCWQTSPAKFIAVANAGTAATRMMTSENGLTWVATTVLPTNVWTSITSSPTITNRLAVVGSSSSNPQVITYSRFDVTAPEIRTNAISAQTSGGGVSIDGALINNGALTCNQITSNDTSWVTSITPNAGTPTWTSIAASPTLLIAVANAGTNRIMGSTDGVTWAALTTQLDAVNMTDITYSAALSLWCIVGSNGTTAAQIWTSATGLGSSWVHSTSANATTWTGVTFMASSATTGTFVSVSDDSKTTAVQFSTAGTGTWSQGTAINGGPHWTKVVGASPLVLFAAVSNVINRTDSIMTSPGGNTWTSRTTPNNGTGGNTWNDITYGHGLFLAVASTGTQRVMTSPDGITWTASTANPIIDDFAWFGVTWLPRPGLFYAVGTNSAMTSPDGITWTSSFISGTWKSVDVLPLANPIISAVSATASTSAAIYRRSNTIIRNAYHDTISQMTPGAGVNVEGVVFSAGKMISFTPSICTTFNFTGVALTISTSNILVAYGTLTKILDISDEFTAGSSIVTYNGRSTRWFCCECLWTILPATTVSSITHWMTKNGISAPNVTSGTITSFNTGGQAVTTPFYAKAYFQLSAGDVLQLAALANASNTFTYGSFQYSITAIS